MASNGIMVAIERVGEFLSTPLVKTSLAAIIVLVLAFLSMWAINAQLRRLSERNIISKMAADKVKRVTTAGILVVLFAAELYIATNHTVTLVILLLVIGVMLAASWRIFSMVTAHYSIILSKLFSPGDFIEVDGVRGRVKSIGLVTTTLLSEDKTRVILPNTVFLEKKVKHLGSERTLTLRISMDFTDFDAIENAEESIRTVIHERYKHGTRSEDYDLHIEKLEWDTDNQRGRLTFILRTKYLGQEERSSVINNLIKELHAGLPQYDLSIEVVKEDNRPPK